MRPITGEELDEVLNAERYKEKRERYVNRMLSEGYDILVPGDDELQLDLDSDEDYGRFVVAIARLKSEYDAKASDTELVWEERPSKSGLPHKHIIVHLPATITNLERIALQAVLGSDRTREMLSLFRLWDGDPVPTLLAEKRGT